MLVQRQRRWSSVGPTPRVRRYILSRRCAISPRFPIIATLVAQGRIWRFPKRQIPPCATKVALSPTAILLCKAKRRYLLTCKVSRYCLLALLGSYSRPIDIHVNILAVSARIHVILLGYMCAIQVRMASGILSIISENIVLSFDMFKDIIHSHEYISKS